MHKDFINLDGTNVHTIKNVGIRFCLPDNPRSHMLAIIDQQLERVKLGSVHVGLSGDYEPKNGHYMAHARHEHVEMVSALLISFGCKVLEEVILL